MTPLLAVEQLPDLTNSQVVGFGSIITLIVAAVFVYNRVVEARRNKRIADAEVEAAEDRVEATPMREWQRLYAKMERKVDELAASNHDCEERSRTQEAKIRDLEKTVDGLKEQNEKQQGMLDAQSKELESYREVLRANGLA